MFNFFILVAGFILWGCMGFLFATHIRIRMVGKELKKIKKESNDTNPLTGLIRLDAVGKFNYFLFPKKEKQLTNKSVRDSHIRGEG